MLAADRRREVVELELVRVDLAMSASNPSEPISFVARPANGSSSRSEPSDPIASMLEWRAPEPGGQRRDDAVAEVEDPAEPVVDARRRPATRCPARPPARARQGAATR